MALTSKERRRLRKLLAPLAACSYRGKVMALLQIANEFGWEALARKRDPKLRLAIAKSPVCPTKIRASLKDDKDNAVRAAAREHVNGPYYIKPRHPREACAAQ
jgi:hypothetical protein